METYGGAILLLGFAGFFISIITGIIYSLYKRTLKYTWIFGCIAGFCFFTVFAHILILMAYDDIGGPNYEEYKNWNIHRFILSDMIRLITWLGIGILNYLAFIKQNKLIKWLFILGVGIFLIAIIIMSVLSSVSTIDMNAIRFSLLG